MRKSRSIITKPQIYAPAHLYCFAYAGGNAARFLTWQTTFGSLVQVCGVQLPGRGARLLEPAYRSWPELLAEVCVDVVEHAGNAPFALFGHSLGALVAFEVARYVAREQMSLPIHLFVSGCAAPQTRVDRALHLLSDEELLDALRDFNGTPPEILGNRELMTLLLPSIRADLSLASSYTYSKQSPLAVPITALIGRSDQDVGIGEVQGWRDESSERFDVVPFDGDHFFIDTNEDRVVQCVKEILVASNM